MFYVKYSKKITNESVMEEKKPQKNRSERFQEIAPKRVNKVLKSIESLSKCSSRNYEYNDMQVAKMFKVIKAELRIAEDKFKSNGKTKGGFRF